MDGLWATKSEGVGLIVRAISFQDFQPGGLRKTSARLRFGRSRSSKVIDFDTNRKRVYDFLFVRYSNLGHYLARFRRYCRFSVLLSDATPIPP